jgi:hypothetical protein
MGKTRIAASTPGHFQYVVLLYRNNTIIQRLSPRRSKKEARPDRGAVVLQSETAADPKDDQTPQWHRHHHTGRDSDGCPQIIVISSLNFPHRLHPGTEAGRPAKPLIARILCSPIKCSLEAQLEVVCLYQLYDTYDTVYGNP